MIEELPEPQQDQEQNNIAESTLYLIRTHYEVQTVKQAHRVLLPSIIKRIQAEQQCVVIGQDGPQPNFPVTLKKKPLHKSFHLLKVKRRVGKHSQSTSYKVEESTLIRALYDFEDIGDLVSSQGTNILGVKNPYAIDKQDLLQFVKAKLERRIADRANNCVESRKQEQASYKLLIKPECFFKEYNLAPPKCDFFQNRIKQKDQKQFNYSYNINYEDPIPTLAVEVPPQIRESQLYQTVLAYLQKRPCWLKNVLLVKLKQDGMHGKFSINQLKNVLKYLCYTFKNGPWKHTFCMFGFNPRSTYKAIVYQNVSLKLKKKEAQDYEQQVQEQLYDPTFLQVSNRCMRTFQLGDIALEQIKEIIRGKLISQERECTKQYGWLSVNEYSHILKIMKHYKDTK